HPSMAVAIPAVRLSYEAGRGSDGRVERKQTMFYELRQYTVKPGQQERWVKCMEEEIIPFQVSKGMVIAGSFKGEADESVYVWMRRFTDEAERERLYEAVYQSDYWKNEIAPRIPEMLDREAMKVTRIVATPKSVLQ
ncbi:MAG: NIPSNAP family protein, partial [Dehalococcoidia bacterium]